MSEKTNRPAGPQVQINASDEVARGRYSNNMLVTHTREEFILDFLLTAPNGTQLVSRVMISPGHMKRVLSALVDNMNKYEANFGEVVAPEGGHTQFH
ncbi:MAG: DUF3467 domain-containing protein [marine benthic group bacterium]|jgi:hypothetical protein|nr:DUF3467 domain-containing protein [Candidatus Benthicola marisminoris]